MVFNTNFVKMKEGKRIQFNFHISGGTCSSNSRKTASREHVGTESRVCICRRVGMRSIYWKRTELTLLRNLEVVAREF